MECMPSLEKVRISHIAMISAAKLKNSSAAVVALMILCQYDFLTEPYNVTIAHVLIKVRVGYLRMAVSLSRALSPFGPPLRWKRHKLVTNLASGSPPHLGPSLAI